MAVAIEMNFKGTTPEQYDKVIELMGDACEGIPPGAIFHWAAKTRTECGSWTYGNRGRCSTGSRRNRWSVLQQAGITEQPEMTYRDVYNHLPRS